NQRALDNGPAHDAFGAAEREFIAARDSFYMATVNQEGWPYIQHRGGSPGFLRVVDAQTLAFPDFEGNRQYVSVGNLDHDARVCLFLVDYPRQRRLKIFGHARVLPAAALDDALHPLLRDVEAESPPQRLIVIALEGYEWNCPRYITPRYTAAEARALLNP
ncbi:MAG TPA: pyridoxamine 5'-phosphate oxidase family protein, partial [Rhodocyclaceae bacterium]